MSVVGGLGGVCGLENGLLIWVLCPLSAVFWAVKAGSFDLALRAASGDGVTVGSCGVLWAGAEECGSYGAGAGILCLLPAAC